MRLLVKLDVERARLGQGHFERVDAQERRPSQRRDGFDKFPEMRYAILAALLRGCMSGLGAVARFFGVLTIWTCASCAAAPPIASRQVLVVTATDSGMQPAVRHGVAVFPAGAKIKLVAQLRLDAGQENGDAHHAVWRLMQNGRILHAETARPVLRSGRTEITSHISAGSFPPGDYDAQFELDGTLLGSTAFEIMASQEPAVLARQDARPGCGGFAKSALVPSYVGRPLFPERAMDHARTGCAVVAIRLGDGGAPVGVRLQLEDPAGWGFGQSAYDAAWNSVYPSGHGGETVPWVVNFRLGRM